MIVRNNRVSTAGILIILLMLMTAVPLKSAGNSGICPYSSNSFYWQYNGEPLLLLGGSKEDNLFQIPDLKTHLDAIKADGVNYIRNTMSDRNFSGFEIKAFYRNGSGKYDLDKWNENYWNKFKDFLDWTSQNEIIVQIELWDRFDFYKDPWKESPFNPDNNLNYSSAASGLAVDYPDHPNLNTNPFFETVPDMKNNRTVLVYQQKFVDRFLSIVLNYNHVLYCMDNETSCNPKWGAYWSNYIRNAAKKRGKTVETTEMWDAWDIKSSQHRATLDHPETYSFCDLSQNNQNDSDTHWDNVVWVRDYLKSRPCPMNSIKVYGADGGPFGSTQNSIERFMRNIFGGVSAVRFHRPYAGLGASAPAVKAIAAVRKMVSTIPLWEMVPRNDLLTNRKQNEAFLSAKPGKYYAVYFTSGGSIGLNLKDQSGSFSVQWINVSTGEWGNKTIIPAGGTPIITAPGAGGWIAVATKNSSHLAASFEMLQGGGTDFVPVRFDASSSVIPVNGTIQKYHWIFGDGTTGEGQTIEHIYTEAGNYLITLQITDNSGHVATCVKNLVIQNPQFSPDSFFGNALNYQPINRSRWNVCEEGGDRRYFLNTSSYQGLSGDRLGAISLLKNRVYVGDFSMRMKVKSDENLSNNRWSDIAVIFAYQNEANYCYASLNSQPAKDGATGLYKVQDGQRSSVAWSGVGISDNQYHEIEVIRYKNTISLLKNGKILVTGTDSRFEMPGSLGIGSYNDRGYFDDIYVSTGSTETIEPPSALTATALSAHQVRITWSNGSSSENGTIIERKKENELFVQIGTAANGVNEFIDNAVSPGTRYFYQVSAFQGVMRSGASNIISLVVPEIKGSFCDGEYGDPQIYTPLHDSNWQIISDQGDVRYALNTTDYQNSSGNRLGEYTIIKNQMFDNDFTITLFAKSIEDLRRNRWADFALVFAYQNDLNYCYASFSSQIPKEGATGLYKVVNGQRSTVLCSGLGISDNQYHSVALSRKGTTVTIKRDGIVLVSAADLKFGLNGNLGLGSFNDGVYFDDIQISDHAEPAPIVPPGSSKDGTIAYWSFDQTAGNTVRDISGHSHDATLENGALSVDGKSQKGIELDGLDDRIAAGSLDVEGGSGFSITAWIRADNFSTSDARIISKATGVENQDHYWMLSTIKSNGIKLRFRLRTDNYTTTQIASTGNLDTNTWIHVAATWDGHAMRLYKDGLEVGNLGKTGRLDMNNQVLAAIGNQPSGAGSRPFDGKIDEVALFNRALNHSEIREVMNGILLKSNPEQFLSNSLTHVPENFMLYPNFPNPFNAVTTLTYQLTGEGFVCLKVYNTLGHPVQTLLQEVQSAGQHQIIWKGLDKSGRIMPSGSYVYRIQVLCEDKTWTDSGKMTLTK